MNISDQAVEAAANAISECSGMRFDGFWSRVEDLDPEDREYALMEARAALEASAPTIRAEARAEVIAEMLEDADAESKHANWQNERHTANLVHDWLRTWDDEQ